MICGEMKWEEQYNVGVDAIDQAHQEFFRILARLQDLSQTPARHEWVATEGLKYLKQYTLNHFANEEKLMISIRYCNFKHHRKQHVVMREKVLPKLERHLRSERYSPEAIEKFLQIMRLWLTRHIMVHDKAIGWAIAASEQE